MIAGKTGDSTFLQSLPGYVNKIKGLLSELKLQRGPGATDMYRLDFAIDLTKKRLVFLVGAPRSGTTWLQLMLASSDQVATVNETHLFSLYLVSQFESWERLRGREIGLRHLMTEAEFIALIRHFADCVISRIIATKPNAVIVLEKTPHHVLHWRNILKIYPDAYFIVLTRDPRAVVASLRAASKGWGSTWISSSVVGNSKDWKQLVLEGQQIRQTTKNVIEVRYEDLHADCAAELSRIFDWMGVNYSNDECLKIAGRHHIEEVRSGKVNDPPWDLSKEPLEFYRRGEIDSWRTELTPRQIYLVETIAGDLMDSYRYVRAARLSGFRQIIEARLNLSTDRLRAGIQWRLRRIADSLSSRV